MADITIGRTRDSRREDVKVVGVAMVRDEADVLEGTLRHMADEVDWLLVADNGSVDGTREILTRLTREIPLRWVDDPEPAYHQGAKMSALASMAADDGATWIVPFDADEVWTARYGRIRELLPLVEEPIATAELTNHFCTALDVDDPDPFRSMVWRQRDPGTLPKVAFRHEDGAVIHQGNHGVTLPSGGGRAACLQIRHFPYRSPAQLTSKALNGAAAYRAAPDLPEGMGVHWRAWGELAEKYGPDVLGDVFRQHFWHLSPIDAGLVRDPAPYLRWR